jgi:hypothetical protein
MAVQVLLVQGGSEGAYAADARLADSLRTHLGSGFEVRYPALPNEDEPNYAVWKAAILGELRDMGPGAYVVGHSIGGSVLIKMLTEGALSPPLGGVFLAAAPFWYDDDFWRWDEAALPPDAAQRIPPGTPLFLYHGEDDPSVPVEHLGMYAQALPAAVVRALPGRDHQLNDDMSEVARDIRELAR